MIEKIEAALKALKEGDSAYAVALLKDIQKESNQENITWLLTQALLAAKEGDESSLRDHLEAIEAVSKNGKDAKDAKDDKGKDTKGKKKKDEEEEEEDGKKKKKLPFPGAVLFKKKGESEDETTEAQVIPIVLDISATTSTGTSSSAVVVSETTHEEECADGKCPYEHTEAASDDGDLISETFAGRIEEALTGPNAYRVTLIEAGMSKNRNFWSPRVLQNHSRLFQGAKAFADHPTRSEMVERSARSVKDIIGWYDNIRWVPTVEGGKLKADFSLLEGPIADMIRESHARGKSDLVQLSVNISGKRVPKMINGTMAREVTEIHRVHSVDAVTEASAGGSIDQLVASESMSKEVEELMELDNITPEDLLAAIKGREDLQTAVKAEFSPSSESSEETKEEQTTESEEEEETTEEVTTETPEETESADDSVQKLTEAVEQLQRERLEQASQALLELKLGSSSLPEPVKTKIRNRHKGEIVEAGKLDQEIEEEKQTLQELSIGQPPMGASWAQPSDVQNEGDRWAKAMDGLLAGEAVDGVEPFMNLRHAFYKITGKSPFDQTGYDVLNEARGYDSGPGNSRIQEAFPTALTTGNFTKILGDSITRRTLMEYRFPALQEWRRIASTVPVSDLREQKRERLGEFYLLKHEASVAAGEGVAYADLSGQPLPEEEAIYTATKAHGMAQLNLEIIINDDIGKFRNIPKMLGRSAAATIYVTVFDFLKTNPAESTYLTGGGSDTLFELDTNRSPGNIITDTTSLNGTVVSLNDANLSDAQIRFRIAQAPVSGTVPYSGATAHSFLSGEPKNLIVAPTNRAVALALMGSDNKVGSANNHEMNIHKGTLDMLVVPYWETASDVVSGSSTLAPKNMWFVTANPGDIPLIEVGFLNGREDPEIFTQDQGTPTSGEFFELDQITYKVRHFWGANPMEHRGMVGATAT